MTVMAKSKAATPAGPALLARWTMPLLRISMGVFMALWGIDKIVATEGAQGIFTRFYSVNAGTSLLQLLGAGEIVLGVVLAIGVLRTPAAWLALIANSISTIASWQQIIDPWGLLGISPGGTHLFLASIVIMAVNVVLVLNTHDDTGVLRLRRRSAEAGA